MGKCFSRLKWELTEATWFGLEQPNGDSVSVDKSFSRRDWGIPILFSRFFFFSWSTSAFTSYVIRFPLENKVFFLGYFSHWVWIVALLYQLTTLFVTVFRSCNFLKQPPEGDPPYFFARLIIFLYSTSASTAILLNFLYYLPPLSVALTEEYSTYLNTFLHTVLSCIILIDGAIVSRIPVKLKHFLFVFLFMSTFLIWTVIQDLANIGGGSWPQQISFQSSDTNATISSEISPVSSTPYPFISWKDKPGSTVLFYFIALFVVAPSCHIFVWLISLKPRPIYGGIGSLY